MSYHSPMRMIKASILLVIMLSFIFSANESDTFAFAEGAFSLAHADKKDSGSFLTLAPGMELGEFSSKTKKASSDPDITILRIDPSRWQLKLLSLSGTGESDCMTVKEWCAKYNIVAGINAGMFADNYSTHIGYMKCGNDVNNSKVNSYKSAAAFSPKVKGIPPFRIFDLDKTDISTIKKQYDCVIQNLRLIKHPGVNVWGQQEKKWSEVALGEDKSGRALFIFCRTPYSMRDLNDILLSLPIELVCAQHLEGGPEAQMYVKVGKTEIERAGSFETGFTEDKENRSVWAIPNVIGIFEKD